MVVKPRSALKEFDFASPDFKLDSNFISNVGRNLAPRILAEEFLDSLSLKFG